MDDWVGVDLTDYFDPGGDDYSPPTPVDHWSELPLQSDKLVNVLRR